MSKQRNIPVGIAGIAGGLVASFVMNEFMTGPGKQLAKAVQTPEEQQQVAQQTEQFGQGEDATMKAADAIASTAAGGQHLTHDQRSAGGPMVHYAFGCLMGGLYGGLAEVFKPTTSGFGTTFGSVLFTGADLFAVPALKLAPSPQDQPTSALAAPFAAHIIYGTTTELVRRLVRALL